MNKKLFTLISAILISMAVSLSCTAQRLFPNLKADDGLTTIYVGKTMLRLAGGTGGKLVGNDNIGIEQFINYLNSVEIVSAEKKKCIDTLDKTLDEYLKSHPDIEIATEIKDDEDDVTIYTVPGKTEDSIGQILLVVKESDEFTVIDLRGDIPISVFEQAVNAMNGMG